MQPVTRRVAGTAAAATNGVDDPATWRGAVERLVHQFADMEARQADLKVAVRQFLLAVTGDPPVPAPPLTPTDLPSLLGAYERSLVLWALAKSGGRQRDAARLLGVQPTTLNEKMKRLGLTRVTAANRAQGVARA
jgi:DNA-binding NtrC family response regulator